MAAPKKYSDELRERATRLALESGRPIAHVARDLGVHKEALRTWVSGRPIAHVARDLGVHKGCSSPSGGEAVGSGAPNWRSCRVFVLAASVQNLRRLRAPGSGWCEPRRNG